tara:strand:+ start:664 stop:882 length:219 start_codon:yes stop_codon:yes gene_type:complete
MKFDHILGGVFVLTLFYLNKPILVGVTMAFYLMYAENKINERLNKKIKLIKKRLKLINKKLTLDKGHANTKN